MLISLLAAKTGPLYRFLLNKWKFDELLRCHCCRRHYRHARLGRWFDNRIIDGIVNGIGSWTRGRDAGHEAQLGGTGNISPIVYMIVTAGLSLYVGWVVGFGLMPAEATIGAIAGYVVLGLAVSRVAPSSSSMWASGGFDNQHCRRPCQCYGVSRGFHGIADSPPCKPERCKRIWPSSSWA